MVFPEDYRVPKSDHAHRFFTGSFFPELETALGREVAEFKREHGALAPLTILVPSNLLRVYLPRRLAESFGGHANLRFQTLGDLVRSLVPTDLQSLPPFGDELILAGVIQERVKPDSYFGSVRQGLGFRSALLGAIHDLKQADVTPALLRKATRQLNQRKFEQLADLFEAYEDNLKAAGFADDSNMLKLAELGARNSELGTRTVIYGFYDFNHLQRQLIKALVSRIPTTVFMPYHPTEAFRYAEATRQWFEQVLGVEPEPIADTGDVSVPATLDNLRSRLFLGREIEPSTEPEPSCFSILSAPGESREVKEVLRESVRFADETKRPLFHAAVVARRTDDYADPLRDCAGSRGYKVHVHGGRSLLSHPVAQAVLLLPRIVRENFGRRIVLEFLSLAPVRISKVLPAELQPGFLPSAWGQITAEAGIVSGAASWEQRVTRWIRSEQRHVARIEESGGTAPATLREQLLAARALGTFVRALFAALARIPDEEAKWSDIAEYIEEVARRFLLPSDELEAAVRCVRSLRELERIRTKTSLDEFIEFARRALAEARLRESSFEEGGLFVGGLESCRGVTWPMVVVPGLIESSFPRIVREDPILLDEERKTINASLADKGSPSMARLPLKQAGHDEERLLFQLAVESARERLVLAYPRLDPFNGSTRVPSIFLLHAIEALRGGTANFSTLEQDPLHRVVALREIADQPQSVLLDPGEYDLSAIHTALQRGVRALRPYLDDVSPWIVSGLHGERRRWGTPVFTEFDGVFQSNEAKRSLGRWLKGRAWSVTSLERFARSPFEFFLTELLGIEPIDEPEEAEVISARDLGMLWHDILREVVRRLSAGGSWRPGLAERKKDLALMREVAEHYFAEFEQKGVTGYAILWEVCREKVMADLEAWLAIEAVDSYSPLHLEHTLPPTEVLGVTIQGRVDRIDRASTGELLRLYDYKTGRKAIKAESFNKGLALQVPLYMLALEATVQSTVEVVAGSYFYVTYHGGLKRPGWSREGLRMREKYLRALLRHLIGCVREGRFFLTDKVRDVIGVTMPKPALDKLMKIKAEDPHWKRLKAMLEEEEGATGDANVEWEQLSLLPLEPGQ